MESCRLKPAELKRLRTEGDEQTETTQPIKRAKNTDLLESIRILESKIDSMLSPQIIVDAVKEGVLQAFKQRGNVIGGAVSTRSQVCKSSKEHHLPL